MRRAFSSPLVAVVLLSLLSAGCSAPMTSDDAGAGGGSGGGNAGAGGGGATTCTPGATAPCYSGRPGTRDVGACKPGTQTCLPDGSGFGSCAGEVLPRPETCAALADEDCDGLVNEEGAACACVRGATQPCYSGAPATLGVGLCHGGTQTCRADGLGFGDCVGEVLPTAETCNTTGDDDCDGAINESGAGCVCLPNSVVSCYSGTSGTQGVGLCAAGSATCNSEGTALGPCMGEILPAPETCNTPGDDDCDGASNEEGNGCVCVPMSNSTCYSGPAGTQGVGSCTAGSATCNAQGTAVGSCMGEVLPAFDDCATPMDEDCNGLSPSCTGAHLWSKRFGDANDQRSNSVAIDSAGNVYVTGTMFGTVDFGGTALTSAGSGDVFLAKFDPAGNHLWSKRFGDASPSQSGTGVATDAAGNVVITGYFMGAINFGGGPLTGAGGSDIFVARFDGAGNHLWSKRFGDANEQQASALATDSASNVVLTGFIMGSADFGGGPLTSAGQDDAFAVKLDASGNHVWSKRFGDAGDQRGNGVAIDRTGQVVLTGSLSGAVDFGGGSLTSAGGQDVYLAKFDGSGTHLWSKRFGDAAIQSGTGVALDAAGSIILTGSFGGVTDFGGGALTALGIDVFVARFDPSGGHRWSKRFGDPSAQQATGVATDIGGNVLLTGFFVGSLDFGGAPLASTGVYDAYVAKLDSAGATLWSKRFGGTGAAYGISVATDSAANVVSAGHFSSTVDYGGGSLTSAGGTDGVLLKLAP